MLLLLIEGRRDRQDNRDRTSGPMPAAMRRGRTATFRAASTGLDGNQASPLMLFQQSAELSVLRPQGSLCIAHTVMIADRQDALHASGVSGLSKASTSWHRTRSAPPRHTGNQFTADAGANTRELMVRMGHDSERAALIYLHSSD